MEALRNALKGRSSVFVGQSGVGKSSLVNALLPHANARVGDLVRSANQIGAHTTSSSHLFHLADVTTGKVGRHAGTIIDSPGIREVGLWHLPVEDIREGFVEVNEASKRCKYRNCTHTFNQEGCGVIAALEVGAISAARYDSYMDLVDL
jgi:ribosome biogenesis GTPase